MKLLVENYLHYCQISCFSKGAYNQTLHYVKCQPVNVIRTRERLSTYSFDTMKLKVLFFLNCESSKYIAKLFSLSICTCI